MTLASLINTPATIIRRLPGEEDEYGNIVPVEEEVDTVCELQKQVRRASEEPGDQGELSDTLWLGIFPAETELDTGDAVRVEGVGQLELVGDPWRARNPRTQQFGQVEANLRRTAGAEAGS